MILYLSARHLDSIGVLCHFQNAIPSKKTFLLYEFKMWEFLKHVKCSFLVKFGTVMSHGIVFLV